MRSGRNNNSDSLRVHVYSAGKRPGLLSMFRSMVAEFPISHSLGYRFAERNIRAAYRQSIFGVLWAFLPPIGTALIWIILNRTNIVTLNDVGVAYPVFVITGTLLWSTFVNAILTPMKIMQSNKGILTKVNFPREALLIDSFYEILFNAGITLVIIIGEMILFQVPLTWHVLLFIPSIMLLIILGISIGLLLMPVSMLYKDIQFLLPSLLQFAMYVTPVVYSRPVYKGVSRILEYNPVTPVLTNARAWLLGIHHGNFDVYVLLSIAAVASVLLMIGLFMQRVTIEILIERMGT